MKIGISSYAYRWAAGTDDFHPRHPLSLPELLAKCVDAGARTVQICENFDLLHLAETDLVALSNQARSLDLTLEVGMRGADTVRLRRYLNVSRILDAPLLRIVVADGAWKPTLENQVQVIRGVLSEFPRLDTTLAIENHFHFDPEELAALVLQIDDSRAGICLDPLNSISRLVGPEETVNTLAEHTVTMHAKDARTERHGTSVCVVGCPLGQGMVDLPGILRRVRQYGRLQSVHVEAWMDRVPSDDETVRREEERVAQDITYLRSIV